MSAVGTVVSELGEASRILQKAASLAPKDPDIREHLAVVHAREAALNEASRRAAP